MSLSGVDPRVGRRRLSRSNRTQAKGTVTNAESGVLVACNAFTTDNASWLCGIQMTLAMEAACCVNPVRRFTGPCDEVSVICGDGNVRA